ncbi:MerR family transcriptional regulator [Lactiplantibacillus plajomi]|uniref:MerR family transcriptional regulator n=1 Tax=Lactiplantibacillus plajomi TaxID=1457217 RepID=A0ABV6K189_9LACO|nr:MerR family transcriptional regulator [Lactiplantibacillus plajomi]
MKIDAVAQRYQISAPTLRYYERQGLLGPVQRVHGVRDFCQADLDRIDFILCVKQCGMTLKEMKHFIDMYHQGDTTIDERLAVLQHQLSVSQQRQVQLAQSIEHLKTKIGDVRALQAHSQTK